MEVGNVKRYEAEFPPAFHEYVALAGDEMFKSLLCSAAPAKRRQKTKYTNSFFHPTTSLT
jgi:hypothetical protein